MRIAYDARSLFGGGTGDRTYLRELLLCLCELRPHDERLLYAREADADRSRLASRLANTRLIEVASRVGALWNQLALAPRLKGDGAQILHAQYLLPPLCPVPSVVTIHDITFRLFPEWFAPRARRIMDTLIPLSARRASLVLTGSQCAREDMIRHFGIAPEKIVVTPYAASPRFAPLALDTARLQVLERHGLSGPYFVGVGLRGVRKNVAVLAHAIERLQASGDWPRDAVLALCGEAAQFPELSHWPFLERVKFLGYVADEDLPALYSASLACVYPSLYEGFGLPPLEAMACGAPVLSSDRASLPEVVGQAGLLISPLDEAAWAHAMGRVLSEPDLRREMSQSGIEQAARFSWQRCAQQTVEAYESLLN